MKKKILLVEDHEDSRAFLKFALELDGYEVLEAANGQTAIEAAQAEPIDLLLMDIAMPDMSGLAVIKRIRENGISKDVPAVALSAFGKFFHEKALIAGFDYFVDKPVNLLKLHTILERYFRKKTPIAETSNDVQNSSTH